VESGVEDHDLDPVGGEGRAVGVTDRLGRGDPSASSVPHTCHIDSRAMLTHGDSRAVEDVVDLRLCR
jgi:hypothetical protein